MEKAPREKKTGIKGKQKEKKNGKDETHKHPSKLYNLVKKNDYTVNFTPYEKRETVEVVVSNCVHDTGNLRTRTHYESLQKHRLRVLLHLT